MQNGGGLQHHLSADDDGSSALIDHHTSAGEDIHTDGFDAGKDTLMGLGTQAMAEAIARGGGFGIASRVIAEVGRDQQRVARMKKP